MPSASARSVSLAKTLALLTLASACYTSHSPEAAAARDGGARDGGFPTEECTGPAPSRCVAPDASGCCVPTAPICVLGAWTCPTSGACDPACGMTPCATLTEAECIGSPDCGPLYDDFCCPLCLPIGACADCRSIAMYECASIGAACADDPPVCGVPPTTRWPCRGGVAECEGAHPVSNGRCDVAGCVQALEAGCIDDCPVRCVPVTPESCTVVCDLPPPACADGTVPEGNGMCFTGLCIPESACLPAPDLGGPSP